MGIRFHCPHCEKKLNVKSFLAGKRGICPYCDRGLDIPLESEPRNGKAPHPAESVEVQTLEGDADSAMAAQLAAEAFSQPFASSAASSGGSGSGASGSASESSPVQSTTAAAGSSPAGVQQVDPIDENPEAVWYVRPPSGGQFGPAKGDIMRKWLAEGRVSPEALVWREGWADWKEAEPVFPSLSQRAAASPPPSPPATPPPAPKPSAASQPQAEADSQAEAPSQPTKVASPAPRAVAADSYASTSTAPSQTEAGDTSATRTMQRRRSHMPALIAVGVLVLVSLGLLVGLIVVLSQTS